MWPEAQKGVPKLSSEDVRAIRQSFSKSVVFSLNLDGWMCFLCLMLSDWPWPKQKVKYEQVHLIRNGCFGVVNRHRQKIYNNGNGSLIKFSESPILDFSFFNGLRLLLIKWSTWTFMCSSLFIRLKSLRRWHCNNGKSKWELQHMLQPGVWDTELFSTFEIYSSLLSWFSEGWIVPMLSFRFLPFLCSHWATHALL